MLFSHRDLVPRLRLGTKSLGALKACTNLYLVHGSHLKQKKFVGTKSLGITPS